MSESNTPTPKGIDRTEMFGAREGNGGIIRCDACPVLCRIRPGGLAPVTAMPTRTGG